MYIDQIEFSVLTSSLFLYYFKQSSNWQITNLIILLDFLFINYKLDLYMFNISFIKKELLII